MLRSLREWLKRHSWGAGGVGAVALVVLGGVSGALFDSLLGGGESIEDELNKRNLVASEELEALRTQVVVAQEEVNVLNGQLSARCVWKAIVVKDDHPTGGEPGKDVGDTFLYGVVQVTVDVTESEPELVVLGEGLFEESGNNYRPR